MSTSSGRRRLRARLLIGVAAVAMAAPGAGTAAAQEAKWQPWLEAGGMAGTDHSFGDVDMFIPLWQDQGSILFGDLRGRFSSEPTQEGNFGLGYRTQVDPEWILGGYGYFDIQNSKHDNLFYQATLGLEALSVDWDFRLNGYIPINAGGQDIANNSGNLRIDGNTVGITHDKEKPLYGFDGEVGWRLPIFPADGDVDVRAFLGGYYFSNGDVDTLAGPRGRLEVRLYDLDVLGLQSRLTFSGELQWDEPRGTQALGGLELRIPLGAVTGTPGARLSPLDRRMVDRVRRDVDIVTGKYQSDPKDVIVDELTVKTHTIVFAKEGASPTGKGTKDDPVALDQAPARAASLGQNAIIVVPGNGGDITVAQPLQLAAGQALLGGGSKVPLHDTQGRIANFNVPGTRPTLVGTDAGANLIDMAAGSQNEVLGLDLAGEMSNGVFGLNMERAIVKQTGVAGTFQNGVALLQGYASGAPSPPASAFLHIADNSIGGAGEDGILVHTLLTDGVAREQTVIVAGNTVEGTGYGGIDLFTRVTGAGTALSQSVTIAGNSITGTGSQSPLEAAGIFVTNAVYLGAAASQHLLISGNAVSGVGGALSAVGIAVLTTVYSAAAAQTLRIDDNRVAEVDGFQVAAGILVSNYVDGTGTSLSQTVVVGPNTVSGITGVLTAIGIGLGNIVSYRAAVTQSLTVASNVVTGVDSLVNAFGIIVRDDVSVAATLDQQASVVGNRVSAVSGFLYGIGIAALVNAYYGGIVRSQTLAITGNSISGITATAAGAHGILLIDSVSQHGAYLGQNATIAGNQVTGISAVADPSFAAGIAVLAQTYYSASLQQRLVLSGNAVAGFDGFGLQIIDRASTAAAITQDITLQANSISVGGDGVMISLDAQSATISATAAITGNRLTGNGGDGLYAIANADGGVAGLAAALNGNRIAYNLGDGIRLSASGAGASQGFVLGPADSISFNSGFGVELSTAGGGIVDFATDGATITGNGLGDLTGP
jgi:hypothetical protein